MELINRTEKGDVIDPFADPDGNLWNLVWNFLYLNKMYFEALTLAQAFSDCYYKLQEKHKERIHKGTPLQYSGVVYFSLNQLEQSRKYHFLAFIEDVIRHFELQKKKGDTSNPTTLIMTPATIVLKTRFRTTETDLKSLQDFSWKEAVSSIPFYPEQLFAGWIRENEKTSAIIQRSKEERLYKANLFYLKELKREALSDNTGKALELFAFYLFSCVDGFEPIFRKTTAAFHFDVIVRNLVKEHSLVENLGDYIGVECKKIGERVTVRDLDHFIHKLRLHNMKCGVIFTTEGISGAGYKKSLYGREIINKTFQRDGIVIFDITKDDMEKISEGINLLALLLRKYEDTRFK